jgi:hypothetical protein
VFSQNEFETNCGTVTTEKSIDFYNSILHQVKVFEQDFMQKKFSKTNTSKKSLNSIPIKAHIIRHSDGTGGLDIVNLDEAIADLNKLYANAFMEFYLFEGVNFINNHLSDP